MAGASRIRDTHLDGFIVPMLPCGSAALPAGLPRRPWEPYKLAQIANAIIRVQPFNFKRLQRSE